MALNRIFADASNFEQRFIPDYAQLAQMSSNLKELGHTTVLTTGSFELLHIGHILYLDEAKKNGGVLIVGVYTDDWIRERKGPGRPIVPEAERLRSLTHQRSVGIVTLIPAGAAGQGELALIRAVRPDVLVATEGAYTEAQIAELERDLCGRVAILPPMATTTTTSRLRNIQAGMREELNARLARELPRFVHDLVNGVLTKGSND